MLPQGEGTLQGIVGDLLGTQSSILYFTVYQVGSCPATFDGLLTVSEDGSTATGN